MNRKIVIWTLVMVLLVGSVMGASLSEDWFDEISLTTDDRGKAIAVDPNTDEVVIVAWMNVSGTDRVYTAKYLSNGTQDWYEDVYQSDSGFSKPNSISIDSSGNIYVGVLIKDGTHDRCAVLKYDKDGNSIWNNSYNYVTSSSSNCIVVVDSYDNVTLVSGDSNYQSVYLTKINGSGIVGDTIWSKPFSTSPYNLAVQDAVIDNQGNILSVSWGVSGSKIYAFVNKFNSSGDSIFFHEYGPTSDTWWGYSIASDSDRNIIVSARQSSNTTILKFNETFGFISSKSISTGTSIGKMAILDDGGVFVPVSTDSSFVVYGLSSSGNNFANLTHSNSNDNRAYGSAIDSSNATYTVGYAYNSTSGKYSILLNKYAFPDPREILELPQSIDSDITLKDEFGVSLDESDFTIESLFGFYKGETKILEFLINTSVNLTGVSLDADVSKAFVHNLSSAPGVTEDHSLFIPIYGETGIYICPTATSLDEVNQRCPGRIDLGIGDISGNINVTQEGDFYRINGLTSTGAGELWTPGVIPEYADWNETADPFYTTNINPRDSSSQACLDNMKAGDSCRLTWDVTATWNETSSWNVFSIFESVDYPSDVNETNSSIINITISPISSTFTAGGIECQNSSTWTNCTLMGYGDTLTAIRADCSAGASNAKFELYNLDDDVYLINDNHDIKSGGYFIKSYNKNIEDSGNFTLTARCYDAQDNEVASYVNWYIPFGTIYATVLENNMNVSRYDVFDYTIRYTCVDGECGDVRAIIDPR